MANTTPGVDPAQTLAAHVVNTGVADVPAASLTATRRDVLDTFGAMLGGSGAPGIQELAIVTGRWGGKEEASLAVLGGKMPAHHTALVNSAMGHALDLTIPLIKADTSTLARRSWRRVWPLPSPWVALPAMN
jgi:hypothetical protein